MAVLEQLVRPMRPNGDRMKLEGQARGVKLWVEVAGLLRSLYRAGDGADPFVHDRGDAVAHHSQPPIELKRSRGKKTPAFENSFFDKNQPVIKQRPEPGHTFGRGNRRARHLINKNLASHFDGGELQLFLGAKMGEESALAHAQLFGERADGKTFQTLSRGDIDSASEDGFAGAQALGLAAKDWPLERFADAFSEGF